MVSVHIKVKYTQILSFVSPCNRIGGVRSTNTSEDPSLTDAQDFSNEIVVIVKISVAVFIKNEESQRKCRKSQCEKNILFYCLKYILAVHAHRITCVS